MSVRLALFAPVLLSPFALAAAPAQTAAEAPSAMAGTWDLVWQTRRGPERNGYLVVTQAGAQVTARIHGKGSVRAKGRITGRDFALRGSRMAVPYLISGRVDGDRLSGTLSILSVRRHFTGERRR